MPEQPVNISPREKNSFEVPSNAEMISNTTPITDRHSMLQSIALSFLIKIILLSARLISTAAVQR